MQKRDHTCSKECSTKLNYKRVKLSNLDNYGAECVFQNTDIKSKIKATNLERYGVVCTLQHKDIMAKAKATNLERYGNEHIFGSKEIRNKINKTFQKNMVVNHLVIKIYR